MIRALVSPLTALAMLVALAPSATAQSPYARGLDRPPVTGQYLLSLQDAISIGLANNLDVEVERYAPLISRQDRDAAWGAYDPEAFANFGYSSIETPIASSLQAGAALKNKTTDGTGGFRGLLPYLGATYSLALTGERNSTNSSIQSLSPELTSGLTISGSIPLLRGLIWNSAWTNVKTQALRYDASLEVFRTNVMDIVQRITDSYWALIATKEQLRVAQTSLETAEALLEQTETQYEVGVVSKVEVVESEAGVAQREFELIVADNAYRTTQDFLIDVVLGPYLQADTKLRFQPTDDPDGYVIYEVDVSDAVATAFEKRPELEAARKEIDTREVQLRFAKNERLPQFNVDLSYGFQGLAGDVNDSAIVLGGGGPPVVKDDFSDTFDDYFEERGADQFTVRGVFSIPFPNTTARKNATKAQLDVRRTQTRMKRLEQDIILSVRTANRDLGSSLQGIEAAERARLAAAEQLRAEKVRLEHGESTPFDVLQREEDLTSAESRKIAALQTYRGSVTALQRAQGTILEARNVEIEAVRSRQLKPY